MKGGRAKGKAERFYREQYQMKYDEEQEEVN
jgi:hypothetical protein